MKENVKKKKTVVKEKTKEEVNLNNKNTGYLIIKGHDKNPFVKFWNWGWGIYYSNPEFWNYILVGAFTTFVCIAVKLLCLKTFLDQTDGLQLQIAEIISWAVAVIVAFVLNKIVVFKSKVNSFIGLVREIFTFVSGRVFTQIIQMLIMFIFVTLLKLDSDSWVLIFTLLCQVMQILLNFFISKFITFKKKD